MKKVYRTIAGFLAVIMMASSFPVLAVTESAWDNESSTSSQAETTLEDSTTFDDDASDISSHESNTASAQESNASIEDASDSNGESTQQALDEQECNQPSFDDAQVKEPDVNTGNKPAGTAISTAEQLQAIGADEASLAGSYYLTCDIDLRKADQLPYDPKNNFTAIGTSSMPFMGSFDGNGYEIKNIQISTRNDNQGLFGCVGCIRQGVVIANVGVTGSISGGSNVGGIAGLVDKNARVTNCYSKTTVSGNNDIGGIAGSVYGSVESCYNTAAVTGHGSVSGVTGYLNGSVTDCHNTGKVTGQNRVSGIASYVDTNGIAKNCYNAGEVTGENRVGGIASYIDAKGSIRNCYNTAMVTGSNDYAGGVVAYVYMNEGVMDCYNTAKVIGHSHAGGVSGKISGGNVKNCYNTGEVEANDDYAGGVVGDIYNGSVVNCYSEGRVVANDDYAGGVVGYIDKDASIANCYNTGSVIANDDYSGGIVGRVHIYGSVTNCYNTGTVACCYEHVGGVAGEVAVSLTNCYYNIDTQDKATRAIGSGTTSDTVKGLTTRQMIGPQALTNMAFTNAIGVWITTSKEKSDQPDAYGDYIYCYPQLIGFVTDASDFSQFPQQPMHDFKGRLAPVTEYISTAEQLQKVGSVLNGSYVLINDIDLSLADQLPGDKNNNFTAIGTEDEPFMGKFDGKGHEIQNLRISTTTDYQGLFGYIGQDALVVNVGVTGSVSGKGYVGGIAGNTDGSVTDCYNTAVVTGSSDVGGIAGSVSGVVMNCYNVATVTGSSDIGGIAGKIYRGSVMNCYNTAMVNGSSSHIGGIVANLDSGSIEHCYYNTDHSGQATKAIGNGRFDSTVNGLTTEQMTGPQAFTNMAFASTMGTWTAASKENGQLNTYGDHSYCYPQLTVFVTDAGDSSQFPQQVYHDFAGDSNIVTAYISTAQQLQAINAQLNGNYVLTQDIDLSFADQLPDDENNNFTAIGTGDVSFTGKFDGVGHVVKNLQISTTADYQGLFGYIGTDAVVTNLGVTGSVTGGVHVGGIAGNSYGSIMNCYNTAEVTAGDRAGGIAGNAHENVMNCYNTGKVIGSGKRIGGIVGYACANISITNCCNTGDVTGSDESIGGIAGYVDEGSVTNCYNTGKVTGNGKGIGGVAGKSYGSLMNCYNIGKVTGDGEALGGVAGFSPAGNITNCYYNTDNTDQAMQAIGCGEISNTVKGLTTEQMTGSQALTNMVFTSTEGTWTIASKERSDQPNAYGDYTYYYPQLTAFVANPDDPSQFQQQAMHDFGEELAPVTAYISTAEQLQEIGLNSISLAGSYCLICDIDLEQADQLPDDPNNNLTAIGTRRMPFTGKFDGEGHEVQNLRISTTTDNQGLFGYIGENALVANVGVTGSVTGSSYIGGVVGYSRQGRIMDCYNTAALIGDSYYVGGVAGYDKGSVTNCYNTGKVIGRNRVGGVVGYLEGSVTNCYNTGKVEGTFEVGGVVCYVNTNGSIMNCYNTGEVIASNQVGGIVSTTYGSVTNCYNTGEVTGSGEYAGGVAGYLDGSVTNCYSIAAVTGDSSVGGLAGTIDSNGSIADCYCAGKVTGSSNVGNLAGALVGNVTNCYYNIEFTDPSVPDFGDSTGTVTNSGAKYTMQMTGSNAIGADGMQFSDASAWKTTANTDSLAYYPSLSAIETEQPISKPYYNISFDVDPDCTLEADGFDPNGIVMQGGRYVFTTSREDLSIPMQVLLNGEEIAPIATEGNTSTFMIDNVTAPQQVTVTFAQKINGLQISGADTMKCDTTQTLTLTFDPGNLTTGNKAVTWSVVQGSTGDVSFSEQTGDNVVVKATQAGDVTVRATSKIDETVYDDFAITITAGAPSVVFPTQAIVDYEKPLSEATFVGGQGEGTFQFEDQDHVAVDEDNGVGYTVIFTPTDLVNYEPLKADVPVTIRLQITNVSISTPVENRNPSTDELLVMKDSYQQFASEMQGHGLTAENSLVDWSVTGAESPETVIDQTGKLTISGNETAKVLYISITAKGDPTKTAEEQVIVCAPGDFDGTMVVNAMDANLLLHQIQQEIQRAEQLNYLFNPLFNPFYDLNHDNVIDLNDYVDFLKILDGK